MRSIASSAPLGVDIGALELADPLAPPLRYGARPPLSQVEENERLRRGHRKRLALEVGGELVGHARRADPLDAHVDLDRIVEACGRVVLDRHCAHDELSVARLGPEHVEVPVVLDPRQIEVRHVAPVVDDPLRVGVREADAGPGRELERRLHRLTDRMVSDTKTRVRRFCANRLLSAPTSGSSWHRRPMGRAPRGEDPNGIYHVCARGNNKTRSFGTTMTARRGSGSSPTLCAGTGGSSTPTA